MYIQALIFDKTNSALYSLKQQTPFLKGGFWIIKIFRKIYMPYFEKSTMPIFFYPILRFLFLTFPNFLSLILITERHHQ